MEQLTLSRKELYDLVWAEPMLTLSRKFKISDTGLRKICIRLKIPLPTAGHWQKLKFGKKSRKFKLPPSPGSPGTIKLELRNQEGRLTLPEPSPIKTLQRTIAIALEESKAAADITTLPLGKEVTTLLKVLDKQKPDSHDHIGAIRSPRGFLDTRVDKKLTHGLDNFGMLSLKVCVIVDTLLR